MSIVIQGGPRPLFIISRVTALIFARDAYVKGFAASVVEHHARGVRLDRTAFFPGDAIQPCDQGLIWWPTGRVAIDVVEPSEAGPIHRLGGVDRAGWPPVGTPVQGELDWPRRHLLMRARTALRLLEAILRLEQRATLVGCSIGVGELRVELHVEPSTANLATDLEAAMRREVAASRAVRLGRPGEGRTRRPLRDSEMTTGAPADGSPRPIQIAGFDPLTDDGLFVANTRHIGHIRLLDEAEIGAGRRRLRLAVEDPPPHRTHAAAADPTPDR